jgi:methionyl-tRNA formyltransferase
MRILVMGTGPFALPTAQRILELGHDVATVVTRPIAIPAPKKLPPRPVYDWAMAHGLPIFQPDSINTDESIEHLRSLAADLFFVCDYGQILSSNCLAAADLGGINLHGSLLPRHRGAAPVQWALLAGDTVAGVTVIHMTPKLDAGPALAVRSLDVLPDETAGELEPRLAAIGVSATEESLKMLANWDRAAPLGIVQDRSLVTRAPRFSKQHGQLDFRLPAEYLVRLLRACHPWPGTFADLVWPGGKTIRLLIRAARSIDGDFSSESPGATEVADSSSLGLDWSESWKRLLAVQTARGKFLISRVQPAGKREMDVAEFLRGHPLQPGARFALPEPACMMLQA